jgi:4-amino-4-deoxy-L-arabinose transferase-like glycosyltransferase
MIKRVLQQAVQPSIDPGYWVLFFTLVGFGLRAQRLDFQPLWGDEGWSFYFAVQPLGQLLALTAIDIHPPLYYILLKIWLVFSGAGAEEARLLSVAAGTLLVPSLAILASRFFNRQTGVAAAAITSLSPMAIYYSQEVRMYGWVALWGALATYFLLRLDDTRNHSSQLYLLAYVATAAAALYTHYYATMVVLAHFLYIILTRQKYGQVEPGRTFAALLPFMWVGLLYLPWVIYAGTQLVRYIENKRNVEGYAPLGPIRFLTDHLAAFSLGHLPEAVGQSVGWFALGFIAIAALGGVTALRLKKRQLSLLYLYFFTPLIAGYFINLFYPFTPRYFERTLLLAAPAYWLFVATGLAWLWPRYKLLFAVVVMGLGLPVAISLTTFYTVPRYPHEDYRPLLKQVAARATPADTLLASYQWQLGFYHAYLPEPRPKLFEVPGWGKDWSAQAGGETRLMADLTHILAQSPRLWFPAYQVEGHIWEDEAETALANLAYPALLEWYSPQIKLTLVGSPQKPQRHVAAANFEDKLALLAATVGGNSYQAGRDIIPVQLLWQKSNALGDDHRVTLRLADATGRTWATRDSQPRAGQTNFAKLEIGETLADRHGLLTPAGAPPGTYRLLLSVRQGDDARPLNLLDETGQPLGAERPLAEITLIAPDPPIGAGALPIQTPTDFTFGRQARLLGYSLGASPFKGGEPMPLTLFWESLLNNPGQLDVFIELKDGSGQTVASHRQPPAWPSTEWQRGSILRDPHDVALPPTLPPDNYEMWLSLITSEQNKLVVDGGQQVRLATITTTDRPHNFDAPAPQLKMDVTFGEQIRLVGLDLPATHVTPGQMLPVTLYWQAAGVIDKNWTVFVHLTNNQDKIIAQQDQIPGAGQFPTVGWLPNEYLVDAYKLAIPADTPPQPALYWLKIGLYNADGRLPILKNGQIVSDHVILESWPISIE